MFRKKQKTNPIFDLLLENPGHMLVTDKFIAVALDDGRILAVTGDFKNISEEDANLRLQNALKKMQ